MWISDLSLTKSSIRFLRGPFQLRFTSIFKAMFLRNTFYVGRDNHQPSFIKLKPHIIIKPSLLGGNKDKSTNFHSNTIFSNWKQYSVFYVPPHTTWYWPNEAQNKVKRAMGVSLPRTVSCCALILYRSLNGKDDTSWYSRSTKTTSFHH